MLKDRRVIATTIRSLLLFPLIALSSFPIAASPAHAFHPSNLTSTAIDCVITIPSGSVVINRQTVRFPDGAVHSYPQGPCKETIHPPEINYWIESATDYYGDGLSTGFTALSDYWNVPRTTAMLIGSGDGDNNGQGQLLYFFDSIQGNDPTGRWIIQPVLARGCDVTNIFGCVDGCQCWWLASWVVYAGGPYYKSGEIAVSANDQIFGSLTWSSSTLACNGGAMYSIFAEDTTNHGYETEQLCTGSLGTEGDAGPFEAYYLDNCGELPDNYPTFSSISSTPGEAGWTPTYESGGTVPSCSWQVTNSGNQASLTYNLGGGGCVAQNTPILTEHGYVPVQSLRRGDIIMGYDLQTGRIVRLSIVSNTMTWQDSLVSINKGTLLLTSTDQPIYMHNSSYTGWERNPENLRVGDSIYDAVHGQWVPVFSVQPIHDNTRVYDIVDSGFKTFVANDYLMLDK